MLTQAEKRGFLVTQILTIPESAFWLMVISMYTCYRVCVIVCELLLGSAMVATIIKLLVVPDFGLYDTTAKPDSSHLLRW